MKFSTEILQLVNLRYLALSCGPQLPFEISRFRSLLTLIVVRGMDDVVDIPSEIWEMPELRCLKLKDATMRYAGYGRRIFVREEMHTFSTIQLHRLSDIDFFSCFPNIKSLGLDTTGYRSERVLNLCLLHKLEKLRFSSHLRSTDCFLDNLVLPQSLRKLSLIECAIPREFMTTLTQLPHLHVLKIDRCEFANGEWEATEDDEFRSLQFLSLTDLEVVRWRADETNFPRLGHLVVKDCGRLEEIPCGIGEIPTLQLVEMYGCSDSAVASAKQIEEVQQSEYDNYDLQLRIYVRRFRSSTYVGFWELQT